MSETILSENSAENDEPDKAAQKRDLVNGDVRQHLFRLAIPMVWGILSILAIQLIDMFYIGMLGDDALAAVSFTFPVTHAIFSIFLGFGVAMSSVISRLVGAGQHIEMHRVLFHGFVLVTVFGGAFSLLGSLFARPIFSAMGAEGEILESTLDYMYIWFAGCVFVSLPMIGNSAMRGCGEAKAPAYIMGLSALVNLILDPILIFGLIGFAEMGVEGAALATIISYIAGLCFGFYIMIFKMKILVNPMEFGWMRNFFDSAKRLLTIALPASLTNAIQPLLNAYITALLAGSGAYAVAAYGVVTRVEAFLLVPIMALSAGLAPIIGQNYGAKEKERVLNVLFYTIKMSALWSVLTAAFLILAGGFVVSLFADDQNIIDIATQYFYIVPLAYIAANILPAWSSTFNALARPQYAFLILFVRVVVLSLPACYIGMQMAGYMGVFVALAIVNIIAGVLTHIISWRYASRC